MVAPYNPTPTQDPQHDNERPVVHDRDDSDDGPSPFEGTAPDGCLDLQLYGEQNLLSLDILNVLPELGLWD
jgi:hypothetical protein